MRKIRNNFNVCYNYDGYDKFERPESDDSTPNSKSARRSKVKRMKRAKYSRIYQKIRLLVGIPLLSGALICVPVLFGMEYEKSVVGYRNDNGVAHALPLTRHHNEKNNKYNNKINLNNNRSTTQLFGSKKTPTTAASSTTTAAELVRKKILFVEFNCKIKTHNNATLRTPRPEYKHYFDDREEIEYLGDDYDDVIADQFPPDFFSLSQRQHGAVIVHMFGLVYMFIALAIVCDEFFVPALTVITEALDISEDVAGATFMAAGGSAPEFFTSVIGVFIAQNNVGIGTIVGSATFNILFVLAFCTLFSTTVLYLTWWPLFRDVLFYMISLLMLLFFFIDERIEWWEALSLFIVYLCYCGFMKYNEFFENWTKSTRLFRKSKNTAAEQQLDSEQQMPIMPKNSHEFKRLNLERMDNTELDANANYNTHQSAHRCESLVSGAKKRNNSLALGIASRRQSIPILHSGAMFRNGIIQLMSHTLEPLTEKDGSECETPSVSSPHHTNYRTRDNFASDAVVEEKPSWHKAAFNEDQNGHVISAQHQQQQSAKKSLGERRSTKADIEQLKSILEEEEEKPLDMTWPDLWHKRFIYLFLSPILFPLWVTLPDVRKESCKKWFIFTFCGSIFWIACFSYIMVWFANTIGETFRIPTEIIGLTILAAGTSIPDLITSVIVARKGLGDMAVSSSVGSNIFDVCVGLPVPWLLYFCVQSFRNSTVEPIPVSSNGLICSVGMLFFMLVVLVLAIGLSHWQMNKIFGIIMVLSYIVFCVISVKLETGYFECPLRLC